MAPRPQRRSVALRTISTPLILAALLVAFAIWLTLVLAFVFNLVPLGRVPAMPDFLAVVLVFWNVHQTRRIGVGVAFLFGLAMDVHDGAVLGQHALAYTLLGFFATTIHRRLLAADREIGRAHV